MCIFLDETGAVAPEFTPVKSQGLFGSYKCHRFNHSMVTYASLLVSRPSA
jgi:hypothetical protein